MKKILLTLGLLALPVLGSSAIVDRTITRDTLSIPFNFLDSLGSPLTSVAGDSVYLMVFSPGGTEVFRDSMAQNDASITTSAWEDFAGGQNHTYNERVSVLDGTSTSDGVFSYILVAQDVSLSLLSRHWGTFQIVNGTLESKLDSAGFAAVDAQIAVDTLQVQDDWVAHQTTSDSLWQVNFSWQGAVAGTPATGNDSTFAVDGDIDVAKADDFYNGMSIVFTTGTHKGRGAYIKDWETTGDSIHIVPALGTILADNDSFIVVPPWMYTVTGDFYGDSLRAGLTGYRDADNTNRELIHSAGVAVTSAGLAASAVTEIMDSLFNTRVDADTGSGSYYGSLLADLTAVRDSLQFLITATAASIGDVTLADGEFAIVADSVWQADTLNHNAVVGSFGEFLYKPQSASLTDADMAAIADSVWQADTTNHDGIAGSYGATNTSPLRPTVNGRQLDVTTTGEAGIDFSNIAGTLDSGEISDSAFTSLKFATNWYEEFATKQEVAAEAGDSVWGHTDSAFTANTFGSKLRDSLKSAAVIADSVWQADTLNHNAVVGSFGEFLYKPQSASLTDADMAAIADSVWQADTTTHDGIAGSYGATNTSPVRVGDSAEYMNLKTIRGDDQSAADFKDMVDVAYNPTSNFIDANVEAVNGTVSAADSLRSGLLGYINTQLTDREQLFGPVTDTINGIIDTVQARGQDNFVFRGAVAGAPTAGDDSTVAIDGDIDVTKANDFFNNMTIVFTTGAHEGKSATFFDWDGTNDSMHFKPALGTILADNDSFVVMPQWVYNGAWRAQFPTETPVAGSYVDSSSGWGATAASGGVSDAEMAAIADSVWQALVSGHSGTAGSFGDSSQGWGATITNANMAAITDSVWQADTLNHNNVVGSFGEFLYKPQSASLTDADMAAIADSVWNVDTTSAQSVLAGIGRYVMDSSSQVSSGDTAIGGDERDVAIAAIRDSLQFLITSSGDTGLAADEALDTLKVTAYDNLKEAFDDDATGSTMRLRAFNVIAAVAGSSAVNLTGNTTGEGLRATGGLTGQGMQIEGGATSGDGMVISGNGTGDGITITSGLGATGNGVVILTNSTNGTGVTITGSGTGNGATITSGSGVTGTGLQVTAASTNGDAIGLTATGTGVDLNAPDLVDLIWDEDTTGHKTSPQMGFFITQGGAASISDADMGAIADSVWEKDTVGLLDAGKYGLEATTGGAATITDADMASIGDTVWDKVLTSFTITNSAGKILKNLKDAQLIHTGTSDNVPANTSSTLSLQTGGGDPVVVSTDDFYNHNTVIITAGTGIGQVRTIPDYTGANQNAVIAPDWITTPDGTSEYEIIPGIVHAQTAGGGYEGGAVWISPNGVAGTQLYVNGTIDNPIDDGSLADARTVADALMLEVFHLIPGASITLDATYDSWEFTGAGYTVALGGQSISGSRFIQGNISGTGTGAARPVFRDCLINAVTLPQFAMIGCALDNTITMSGTGTYRILACTSGDADGNVVVDFSTPLDQSLVMHDWHGHATIDNMGNGVTDSISVTGQGEVTFNASNTSGVAWIRGAFDINDNSITLTSLDESASFDRQNVARVNADSTWLSSLADRDGTAGSFGDSAQTWGVDVSDANMAAIADSVWFAGLEAHDGVAGSFGDSAQGWGATSNISGTGAVTVVIAATDTSGTDTTVSGVPLTLRDLAGNQIGLNQFTNTDGYTTWSLTEGDSMTIQISGTVHNSHIWQSDADTFVVPASLDTFGVGSPTAADSLLMGFDVPVSTPSAANTCVITLHLGDVDGITDNEDLFGRKVTFTLPGKHIDTCAVPVSIITNVSKTGTSDIDGIVTVQLRYSNCVEDTEYKLTIDHPNFENKTYNITVPRQATYTLTIDDLKEN